MELLRRVVGLGSQKEVFPNQLEQRQDASGSNTATASTSVISSASPASRSSAAAATDALSTSSDSSISVSSAVSSASPSPSDAGAHTVTEFISTPAFTATKTTPYVADGVNATIVSATLTSTFSASAYLATANATAPGIPKNELTACQINGTIYNNNTNNGPFCSPIHEQNLWAGYTYAITWNPALFSNNASDIIVLRYSDQSQSVVWNSSAQPNGKGYVNINMDKSWLMGAAGNDSTSGQNMTFYLQSGSQDPKKGPMISLVLNPKSLPPIQFHKISAKYGLEIGLPIGVAAAVLIIVALWCVMKRNNRTWSDVKGHGADYMAKRSRRRGRAGKEGGIPLQEYNRPRRQDAFADEPYTGGSGNAFRDEVARQRDEDDRFRSYVTSF